FSLNSQDSTLEGQFGLNRSGSSVVTNFTGMGVHSATLNTPVDYHLEYVYYNAFTFVADSAILIPGPQLQPQFSLSLAGNLTYNFQDVTVPSPSAWLWDFGDGNTSSLQNPQHTYAQAGSYTVQLTVTTDCGIESTSTSFNNIDLDENTMTQVMFYPNPTRDQLTISSMNPGGQATVEIYSALGTCLQQSTYEELEESVVVDLSMLPPGLYTLKVQSHSGVISQNITKI
ncbi:PKD domain-containing protein, partial [Schleiferiaceae bacterium]|nr:PKD domain-containing protein [Schleiferiaceae bacterium]